MLSATLYVPQRLPTLVSTIGLSLPDPATGFARVTEQVAPILGCTPALVDVLVCGGEYVVYSVFDCEEDVNHAAMTAVSELTGTTFNLTDDEMVLCGPVLVVRLLK
jgi:hypothetical protein